MFSSIPEKTGGSLLLSTILDRVLGGNENGKGKDRILVTAYKLLLSIVVQILYATITWSQTEEFQVA